MKQNNIYKIGRVLLLLFINITLNAQNKHKDTTSFKQAQEAQKATRKSSVTQKPVRPVDAAKHKGDTSYKPGKLIRVTKLRVELPRKAVPALKDVHSREVVSEFPCTPNASIVLQNIMRRINIRTSTDNKVKLVTRAYFQGNPPFTDEEWLSKLELAISGTANNVLVTSGNLQKPNKKFSTPHQMNDNIRRGDTVFNSITIFDSLGNWVNRQSSVKHNVILYVPAGVKLEVESKYADVILENTIGEVKVRITNGGFTMMDADKLFATSVYGTIYAANIKDAEVDLTNGRLTAKNIGTLDINSKNSTIDLDKTGKLKMISQADQFQIEEAQTISGQKNYGDLRLTTLTGALDIGGVNADMRIRNISPSVSLIKMGNQYADLRLSVSTLKNYTVAFEGTGGNVSTPFEKSAVTGDSFKATIGNANDKPTVFQLKCNNCSVDFK